MEMDLIQLNCDCKAKIIDFLNLEDQIALSLTSKCFKEQIHSYWLRKYKTKLIIDFQDSVTLKKWHFQILFACIFETVQHISIRNLTPEIFEALKTQTYNNVTNFRFSQVAFALDDENHMELITRIFPNLVSFSPHGNFTGKYIKNLHSLQDLDLSYCGSKLDFEHVQDVLASLQLRSLVLNVLEEKQCVWSNDAAFAKFTQLEKLKLNSDELVLLQLEGVDRLQCLTLTDTLNHRRLNRFCYELNVFKTAQILELECKSDLAVPYLDLDFSSFVNLYKIHLVGGNVRIFKDVPAKNLPSLRQVLLTNFIMEKNADLKALLINCKNVTYFSLQQCNLLEPLTIDVASVVSPREELLNLNLYENFICSLDAAPYLQTVEDAIKNLTNLSNYVNISKFLIIASKREEVTYERLTLVFETLANV